MSTEDALFKTVDALLGLIGETGCVSRYISDKDFEACLDACKELNKKRYEEEILIYM